MLISILARPRACSCSRPLAGLLLLGTVAATRLVCHGGLSHIEEPLHYYYDKTCPTSVGALHRQPHPHP